MIQPTKWSVPLGSGADVQDLPNDDLKYASFSKIFPQITQVPLSAGGVAPRRIDFNSLFKLLADNIYYYQNGGVFEYSDTADYEKGALVRYNDKIYLCIQDNSALNTHNPEDMDYWLRVALNNELSDYLPLTGGNVTGNLSVQNKNVVRSVNGVDANEIGNVTLDISSGATVVETYVNGSSWYRIWSDGWLEQGGVGGDATTIVMSETGKNNTVTFLKPFKNTKYSLVAINGGTDSNTLIITGDTIGIKEKTTTTSVININTTEGSFINQFTWYACGQGE
jgi:hypothetical protein